MLNEDIKTIIKKWGQKQVTPATYIFPVLDNTMDEKEKYQKTQNFTRFVNQHIKTIAKEAGIRQTLPPTELTTPLPPPSCVRVPLLKWLPAYWAIKMLQLQKYGAGFEGKAVKKGTDNLLHFD